MENDPARYDSNSRWRSTAIQAVEGEEAISQLFRFDIDLLSDSKGIDPKALLGKNATVVVETQGVGCDISMESSRDLVCRVRIIGITPTGSN